ncbi:MAG: selenium-binding family protein, partial [Acidimicrobiaceae bacterium]|nr:selenium-binding family protein [Acidimicrobiaceae bacterium]
AMSGMGDMSAQIMGDMNMAGTSYLYVWLGDAARKAPDRLAAIDFRRNSPHYGQVTGWALVPGPGGIGNDPHHCMIAANMRMIACGGILSFLRHQPGLFFFDISDPAHPKYLFSRSTPLSGGTDDLRPLPDGGFLVTDMGSATGGSPGRVVELNSKMQVTHEWPTDPPPGFNPHGISIDWDRNLMVTSDFVDLHSTLDSTPGPVVLRGTIRVWNFAERRIIRTITIPGAPGMMDIKFIPRDPEPLAYTAGFANGLLYLVDARAGTAHVVYNLNTIDPGASPQVMVLSPDGRRLFIPMDSRRGGEITMFDVTNPARPRLLDKLELGPDGKPHDSLLTRDHRLVLTDYFLNEDGFGKVHVDGDHRVRVFLVGENTLRPDPRFNLDFNDVVPGLDLRPHGTDAI